MQNLLTKVLDYLDSILGLKKENPSESPPEKFSFQDLGTGKEDTLFSVIYSEIGENLRSLRYTEQSMVNIFFAMLGFLTIGAFSIVEANIIPSLAKSFLILVIIAAITLLWLQAHARIHHDHLSYMHLSKRRNFLSHARGGWISSFETSLKPPNVIAPIPSPGYRKTQAFVAISALTVIFILILGAIFVLRLGF